MALAKKLALGFMLLGGSFTATAAATSCTAQTLFTPFEREVHGGAYEFPYDIPGGEVDGLFWGLSATHAYSSQDGYNDRIHPSTFPFQLYFKANEDAKTGYVRNRRDVNSQDESVAFFQMLNFDFGCTRLQSYTFKNGTKSTLDVPIACDLGIATNTGHKLTVKFTPQVQTQGGYYDFPWAYPTHVNLPASFGRYKSLQFSALGKQAGDSKVTYYLDSFNHTNYVC